MTEALSDANQAISVFTEAGVRTGFPRLVASQILKDLNRLGEAESQARLALILRGDKINHMERCRLWAT